jgi:hypothetical protein
MTKSSATEYNTKSRHRSPWRRCLEAALFLFAWSLLQPAIAAAGGHEWRIETVDGENGRVIGGFCSLAVDRMGNLHAAYWDKSNNALRYAFRDKTGRRWYTMEVDQRAGMFASLALGPEGHPSIAYNSMFETGLHYAHWNGKTWEKFILDPERTDHFLSLQVDAARNPHISYYREEYPDGRYALYLKYVYLKDNTWYIETVDHRFGTGKFNSMALDPQGRPFVAYTDIHPGDLDYASWNGKKWQHGIVDSRSTNGNNYVGIGNSVAIDSHGNPHIAYFDTTKLRVKYAWRENGIWKTEVVDQLTGEWTLNDHLSLALDPEGRPHIAYWDPGSGSLKYASLGEKGWTVETVVSTDHIGGYPSLALDAQGKPYIAYYDATEGTLQLAYGTPAKASPTNAPANRNGKGANNQ